VTTLLQDFFDQNPISQVALVELREGKAEKITELSGNARHHKSKLEERLNLWSGCGKGAASLRYVVPHASCPRASCWDCPPGSPCFPVNAQDNNATTSAPLLFMVHTWPRFVWI
jgi:hypothetical protein